MYILTGTVDFSKFQVSHIVIKSGVIDYDFSIKSAKNVIFIK